MGSKMASEEPKKSSIRDKPSKSSKISKEQENQLIRLDISMTTVNS
jgi:hypothetical protein